MHFTLQLQVIYMHARSPSCVTQPCGLVASMLPHNNVEESAYRASNIMSGTIALGRATTLRGNIGSCFLSAALASTDLVCLLLCLLGASKC